MRAFVASILTLAVLLAPAFAQHSAVDANHVVVIEYVSQHTQRPLILLSVGCDRHQNAAVSDIEIHI